MIIYLILISELQQIKIELHETQDKLKKAEITIASLQTKVIELDANFQVWQHFFRDLTPVYKKGKL